MSLDSTETSSDDSRYVFICYSHADQAIVDREIDWLQSVGYTVWWDARIQAGAEWSDELAVRIQHCEWFLFFASPESVRSQHCRNELNYAQQHERHMVAVELEPSNLPAGLQLMLNARQFLFRHQLAEEEFHRRLSEALGKQYGSDLPSTQGVDRHGSVPSGRKRMVAPAAALLLVLIVAGLAVFGLRDQPGDALQFSERDRVVVGNLDNRTGDPGLGEALESSLRIALGQSQFASIVPEATIRAAKKRMRLDPDAPLDRDMAIELAQREDAKAGVVGRITQLGDTFAISVEVIDPLTGVTIWPGSVRAASRDELLSAIDTLSRQVREQLGESLSSIRTSSLPLAKVTTPDLEALRLYSLAQESVATGDWETGLSLLERATEIDPEFAMAYGKMAAINIAWARRPVLAAQHYELALRNPSRLSPREQAYIEASSTWLRTPPDMRKAWKSMSVMFPGEAVGFNNLGEVFRRYFLDYASAESEYRMASQLHAPWQYLAQYNLGQSRLALGRPEAALESFTRSYEMEANPVDYGLADTYAVLQRHDDAWSFIEAANPSNAAHLTVAEQFAQLRLLADEGRSAEALALSGRMLAGADSADLRGRIQAARAALLEDGAGAVFREALAAAVKIEVDALAELPPGTAVNSALTRLALLARVGLRSQAPDIVASAVAVLRERLEGNGFPVDQALLLLLEAEHSLQTGDARSALEYARRSIDAAELFQAHETLARAYALLGDTAARSRELSWMQEHRGLAFIEDIDWFYGRLFNILDWSRAHAALQAQGAEASALVTGWLVGRNAQVQT